MKGTFFGKYYKFISPTGFSMAIIVAESNEGPSIQLITRQSSYQIRDLSSVRIENENRFMFSINQDGLNMTGALEIKQLHPLSKKVMGPFSNIPFLECRHEIYSMYHDVTGSLNVNGEEISFENGYGYIEGDAGRNFPKKYIWYNSVLPCRQTLTLAIAHIPFGLFSFTGVLCFLKTEKDEYYLCTWHGVKIEKAKDRTVILQKGSDRLELEVDDREGHLLSAPVQGNMVRTIKENLVIPSKYRFLRNGKVILEGEDSYSSCEWVE